MGEKKKAARESWAIGGGGVAVPRSGNEGGGGGYGTLGNSANGGKIYGDKSLSILHFGSGGMEILIF